MLMPVDDLNPYERSLARNERAIVTYSPRSTNRWMMTGFVLAASIPVAFGAYILHRESVYYASLPPGTAACGMGSLGALVIMIFGVPVFGLIGGTVGWVASKIRY